MPSLTPVRSQSVANQVLLRSDTGAIATLTLNRPEARNALSEGLIDALQESLDAVKTDAAVRIVVIAASGTVFSAGHDMREMIQDRRRETCERLFAKCSQMMMSIMRLPQPVIARVQGTATAAGCQLVASCDLAVAADTAKFATPGVNIGLFCSTPMVAISRAIPRKKMIEMLFTGEPVAHTAERLGLVNRVVAARDLDAAVSAMAQQLLSKSSAVLAMGKEAFYRQLEMGVADAYDLAGKVMARNMMLDDAEEGIGAFLEKRPPNWPKA